MRDPLCRLKSRYSRQPHSRWREPRRDSRLRGRSVQLGCHAVGVTNREVEAAPVPDALLARTAHEYCFPAVNPVTVIVDELPSWVTGVVANAAELLQVAV